MTSRIGGCAKPLGVLALSICDLDSIKAKPRIQPLSRLFRKTVLKILILIQNVSSESQNAS